MAIHYPKDKAINHIVRHEGVVYVTEEIYNLECKKRDAVQLIINETSNELQRLKGIIEEKYSIIEEMKKENVDRNEAHQAKLFELGKSTGELMKVAHEKEESLYKRLRKLNTKYDNSKQCLKDTL